MIVCIIGSRLCLVDLWVVRATVMRLAIHSAGGPKERCTQYQSITHQDITAGGGLGQLAMLSTNGGQVTQDGFAHGPIYASGDDHDEQQKYPKIARHRGGGHVDQTTNRARQSLRESVILNPGRGRPSILVLHVSPGAMGYALVRVPVVISSPA